MHPFHLLLGFGVMIGLKRERERETRIREERGGFRKMKKELFRKPTRHHNDAPNQGVLYANKVPDNWAPRTQKKVYRFTP
jgi:hypothetical protein